ncbi:LysR family transcriptional regulator [Variovorax paradoxus]|uniref:LysR family transcriptional regulator n=1 Tax=Variovorax paradoxus TaxID=34073 RepID=UPI001ABC961E
MNLNLLSALDALLAEGSVSGAARRMHVSTPAMSHTLARIREATGDEILVRAGRRLVPTLRAQEMRERVHKLVEEAASLLAPGDGGLEHVSRTFFIRAPDGVAIVFGSVLADKLHEKMPRAQLQFIPDSEGDLGDLRDAQIDLDIGPLGEQASDIQTVPLFSQKVVGVVREHHPMLSVPISAKRFAAECHVAVRNRGRMPNPIDIALAESGYRRFVLLTVPSPYAALMAAARSNLVATAPARFAASVQGPLQLRTFPLPLKFEVEQVVLAWHARFNSDPAHRWLRECIRQLLSGASWPQASV